MRPSTRLSPEYALLGYLYRFPSHGYELHRRLLQDFGYIWHANQSQTYNILKRLEAQCYVSSSLMEQDKLPSRQILQITRQGINRFETWLDLPTKSSVHAIRVEFITRLYFMQMYHPERLAEMIGAQAAVVETGLMQLQENLANLPADQTFNHLALELRITLLHSLKNWLEQCQVKFELKS